MFYVIAKICLQSPCVDRIEAYVFYVKGVVNEASENDRRGFMGDVGLDDI